MNWRFVGLWATAVLASVAAFVMHLAIRFENIRLGYAVGEARREQRRSMESLRLLTLESAALRQPARIEAIAMQDLAMIYPDPTAMWLLPLPASRSGR